MTGSLVPAGLRDVVVHHLPDPGMPSGADWLDRLPRLLADLLDHWSLTVAGPPRHGMAAVVVPVTRPGGEAAALKVVWPHHEAAHERQALGTWAGRGAVRLLAADPSRWALLLERLDPDRDLDSLTVLDSAEQLGVLLRRLDRPAPPWAPRLSDHLERVAGEMDAALADRATAGGLPRRMLQHGRSLARDLAGEAGVDARLLHADLHGQNVLWRAAPGEWVAIDPQALAADPAFGMAPVLSNRWDEAVTATDLRTHLNVRADVLADAAGMDPERARAFAVVRAVRDGVWALQAGGPDLAGELTRAVSIYKAMQPA